MDEANQREFTRIPVHVQAEVKGGGFFISSTATRNLSLKGLLVECEEPVPEGTGCQIDLLLAGGEIRIEAEGTVVHRYEHGIALQFTRILGAESFEHLRKLLQYNAPDPDLVESEFDDSIGIHRKD